MAVPARLPPPPGCARMFWRQQGMDGGRPAKAYEDKTEIILIGTQQQLDKVNIAHLEIG